MNEQQVIALINAQIKANDNKEITGNILNLVLKEMVAQPNLLIGDLSDLSTGINNDIVSAINWLLTQISGGNIVIHTGQNNPNITPPDTYTVGDFYSQLDVMNNPLSLWQYTGTEWAKISNYIDDSIEALDTTWSSYKISEAIKGDRLNSNGTIVLDGNEITISDLSWWIQGNPYILIPPFSDTIPYTSESGYSRKDIVVAIQANSLIRIPGDEGTGIVQPPQVPPNTLLVTEFDVYHDSVGETSIPVFGGQYIEKISEQWFYSQNTANVIDTLPVIINGNRRKIRFQANIGMGTFHIGRLDYGTVGGTPIASIWGGMDVTFQNVGLNDITIKHFDTSLPVLPNTYRILCPQNQDVILKTGESITLSYDNYSGYFNTVSIAKLNEGGGDFIFTEDIPVVLSGTKTLGRYGNGQTIPAIGKNPQEVLQDIALEYLTPSFTSFGITQTTPIEVGTVISGNKNFTFAFQYPENIEDDSISIIDVTNSNTVIGSGLSKTSPVSANIGSISKTAVASHQWRASAIDTQTNTIQSTLTTVTWQFRYFRGAVATIPTDGESLRTAMLSDSIISNANTFSFTTGTTLKDFVIAIPNHKTLVEAKNAGTNENLPFVLSGTITTVPDAGGTPRAYKVYTLSNAVPFSTNYNINVTLS